MYPFNSIPFDNTAVTVELRELIESGVDIWDFDYPSYYKGDEKKAFEDKVTQHYYFRQIGQETPARWLHYFHKRMREIMPYYLQLYKSQEIMDAIEDPFGNVDITETFSQQSSGSSSNESTGTTSTTSSESSSSSNSGTRSTEDNTTETSNNSTEGTETRTNTVDLERRFSNTPQGLIANLDNYLTEATVEDTSSSENVTNSSESEGSLTRKDTSSGTEQQTTTAEGESSLTANDSTTTKGSESGEVTSTLHRKGNHGVNTYAHDMIEYRQTFLNIDMMIINELNDLFLMVY